MDRIYTPDEYAELKLKASKSGRFTVYHLTSDDVLSFKKWWPKSYKKMPNSDETSGRGVPKENKQPFKVSKYKFIYNKDTPGKVVASEFIGGITTSTFTLLKTASPPELPTEKAYPLGKVIIMEPKPGRLVKAVYDFPTDDPAELPLLVGDVVQIKERIDRQWSRGFCVDREGNFPIGFTVDLSTPPLAAHQELFAVTNDFIAQETGDLTLKRGDLVVGDSAVDSNWWRGEKDGISGIFPLTHVWRVDKTVLPAQTTSKTMFARARVKMSMTAQLPEEMDLYKDEIVNVIEEVERGWYRGECNGRQGTFPASFVTLLPDSTAEDSSILPSTTNSSNISATPVYDNKYGYDCINSGINPYGRALYPFQAEYANELSLKGGEIVNLIRHVDENWIEGEIDGKTGIFPANFINIIVDCPKSDKLSENSNTANEVDDNLFPPDTYGRVICDFHPQLEGDVRLKEGDTVTLIRKIDSNWYEVETDNGDFGACPESYIEVIGSGPPSYSEVMGSFGVHNSSLITVDNSVLDHSKNSSESSRPLSFVSSTSDSSFSSQNSANDKSVTIGTTKILDDSTAENLFESKSSLLTPVPVNNKTSNFNGSTYNGNASQEVDIFGSLNNSSQRQLSHVSQPFTPKHETRLQNHGLIVPSIVRTPPRPPPPTNMSSPESENIFNNSFNSSLNSTRQSISSLSSHSSSDISYDFVGESEIRSQIQMKEQVLKQRMNCINKLENEIKNTSNSCVSSEVRSQISQLNDDAEHLRKDIENLNAKLKPDVSAISSERNDINDRSSRDEEVARKKEIENKRREQERKNKMQEHRDCIIMELLQTEKDYVSDLKLLHDTFLRNPEEAKNKGINVMALFGNLDEVISVAGTLLKRLQKQSTNSQLIGECFVDMSDEMKEVYGHYCRNHDEASSVLDKLDPQSSAGQYINHKLEILKRQTNCFDIGAMLIKPVQRILKYPLLLDSLLKCTDDNHPDKQGLKQAIGSMSDVATAINEFKRQKDLVFKYRKQSDTSLSGRISKFNFHSMEKKASRFGMRISSSIGLNTVIIDEEFDSLVKKFKAIEKCLNIFDKDVTEYTKKAEELYTCTFNLAESIAELYQERKNQQEVDQFRSAHRVILAEYWESFKQTLDCSIHSPIKQLLKAYVAPKNLIDKRRDKLYDFLMSTKRMEKNKDVTKIKMLQDSQLMDKNNYEALNSQLLTDLPKLCDLSVEIFCDCIRCFLRARKNFVGRTAKQMIGLMDLPLMIGSEGSDILETFQVKHTLVMDDLSRLSIAFNQFQSCIKSADTLKKNPSPKGNRLSFGRAASSKKFQTPSQKEKIKSTYSQAQLYTASENFEALDIMHISLKKGDVVGVIKQQDPMGNTMKWFVDSGAAKGFVPAKCLMKFLPDSSTFTSMWDTQPTSAHATKAVGIQNLHNKPMNVTSQPQAQTRQNISSQPQILTRQNTTSVEQSKQQVLQPQVQNRNTGVLQPTRPAPPVIASFRMVAPSRYPPVSYSATSRSKENNPLHNLPRTVMPNPSASANSHLNLNPTVQSNLNSNSNAFSNEPLHRYEEIPDSPLGGLNRSNSGTSSTTQINPSNILDEFDPYSSPKVPEVYDNVPDNLNSLYSSHRYEDIPEDLNYDEVPSEAQPNDTDEYYYGLYDFDPTGPNQLMLRKGQVVLVLHKCDLNQNSEWWFVEDRHGSKGYVPALYLNKYSKDAA